MSTGRSTHYVRVEFGIRVWCRIMYECDPEMEGFLHRVLDISPAGTNLSNHPPPPTLLALVRELRTALSVTLLSLHHLTDRPLGADKVGQRTLLRSLDLTTRQLPSKDWYNRMAVERILHVSKQQELEKLFLARQDKLAVLRRKMQPHYPPFGERDWPMHIKRTEFRFQLRHTHERYRDDYRKQCRWYQSKLHEQITGG